MASTTFAKSTTIPTTSASHQHHSNGAAHSHRTSFSSAPPQPLVTSSSSNLNAASNDGKMSQSQPSSQQSFTMSQPSASQGFRPFSDSQSRSNQHNASQIYSASYSSVEVYEMEVNGVSVMRRRRDSWLNATQILKVAGVDKGKRTKILEKEIQTGEHEKVQGGYGKYQGTWIRFERGVQVCRQYGVEEILRPLLTYDMGQDGGVAGSGDFNTPTKEQALAAQRKRMYSNMGNEGRTNGTSGTFFKNISSTASTAVAAISKARFDSPGPRGRTGSTRPPSFSRQSSMQNIDDFPGNSQQSFTSEYGTQVDSAYSTQNTQIFNTEEPPRKKQRVVTPSDSFAYASQSMDMYANTYPGSPTEPNESFIYNQAGVSAGASEDGVPLPPLPYEMSPEAEQKRNMLMGLFMDANIKDFSKNEALQTLSPLDLDSPIDTSSHTALHWAATLARIPLLRALISAGADPFRVNGLGETALMRACGVTNNSDQSSFPELLDALGSTIEVRDKKGRTVLHHIAVASAVKGRSQSSRYYLESLLEWVVRQGSAPSSQGSNGGTRINLGRFMSEIVNAQDNSGDTALNIAARITNRSIISQLLEVGADPGIPNNTGLRPVDFGIKGNGGEEGVNGDAVDGNGALDESQKSRESSDDIIKSITNMLTDTATSFHSELKKKQTDLDSLHASLRTTSQQLGDANRDLDSLQKRAQAQNLTRQKIYSLSRGREDEQVRLQQIEQSQGPLEPGTASWEAELVASTAVDVATLPSAAILRARIQALRSRSEVTRKTVGALKGRSKDVEVKYRRVVALCSGVPESDVDVVIDGLLRAVESEKDGLEIGRVRRFLGGVDGVA
ncbi:putative HTH APSES-type domain-containing protein [Seiridium cardinale]|uniref:HTH APSES-type domain-containing protein n=1 Tax=Seiridium cardinale TaxID=138064 RepID=A0ABR2XB24_9PEZI